MEHRILFNVGWRADKKGLQDIKKALNEIKSISAHTLVKNNQGLSRQAAAGYVSQARQQATQLEKIFTQSFNKSLNAFDTKALSQKLAEVDFKRVQSSFNKLGATGDSAFRQISGALLNTNVQLKHSTGLAQKMATTLANTARWTIASTALVGLTTSLADSVNYVQKLDNSLNDIRIVTDKSADEMSRFALEANNAAKALSSRTLDFTRASLIYYQQGLNDDDVAARTETTIKAANVTQQSATETSEQLTAIWNGYKIASEGAEEAIDKVAAVAASTASDLEELSIGMSKVASVANVMGVDIDQLNAILSTVISVTKQAPESVGTAYKTIFSRLADLKIGGEDEFGVDLGEVSGQLQSIGIKILDNNRNLREMGKIVEEVGTKWGDWTRAQRQAAAVAIAGKRQSTAAVALFDNWDKYQEALAVSQDALGTLDHQQDIFAESSLAHLRRMQGEWDALKSALIDEEDLKGVMDALGSFARNSTHVVQVVGGLPGLLTALGSVGVQALSVQIGEGLTTIITNFERSKQKAEAFRRELEIISRLENEKGTSDGAISNLLSNKKRLNKISSALSQEEYNKGNDLIQRQLQAEDRYLTQKREKEDTKRVLDKFIKNGDIEALRVDSSQTRKIDEDMRRISERAQTIAKTASEAREQLEKLFAKNPNGLTRDKNGNIDPEVIKKESEAINSKLEVFKKLSKEASLLKQARFSKEDEFAQEIFGKEGALGQGLKDALKIKKKDASAALVSGGKYFQQYSENILEKLENAQIDAEAYLETVKKEKKKLDDLAKRESNFETSTEYAKIQAEQEGAQTQDFLKTAETRARISTIVQGAGAYLTLASSVNTVTNAFNSLNDTTLSTEEKTQRLFSSLLVSAPMMGYAVSNVFRIAQGAMEAFQLSATATVGIFGGVAIAITAVTATIGYFAEQARKAREELQSIQQESSGTLNEIAESDNLHSRYEELLSAYKETGRGKEELNRATLELCSALGVEINSLELLGTSYDNLSAKINKTRLEKQKDALDAAKQGALASQDLLLKDTDRLGGLLHFRQGFQFNYEESDKALQDAISRIRDRGSLKGSNVKLSSLFGEGEQARIQNVGLTFTGVKTIEDFVAVYKAVQEEINYMEKNLNRVDYKDVGFYKNAKQWLRDNRENVEKYNDFQKEFEKYALESAFTEGKIKGTLNTDSIKSVKDFNNFKSQFLKEVERAFEEEGINKSRKDLSSNIDKFLSSQSGGLGRFAQESQLIEGFREQTALSTKEVEGVVDKLQREGRLSVLASIHFNTNDTIESVEKQIELAKIKADEILSADNIALIQSANASVGENGNLSKLEKEQRLLFEGYLEATEGIRGMTSAMEEWKTVSVQGVQEQVNYLHDLAQAEVDKHAMSVEQRKETLRLEQEVAEIRRANAIAHVEELQRVIDANKELEGTAGEDKVIYEGKSFKELKRDLEEANDEVITLDNSIEQIKEKLNDEFAIELEVSTEKTDALTNFADEFVTRAESARRAAELIGEGFKVAANDAQQLLDIFPELYENAKVLKDGTVELSKETVQAVLGDETAILEADKESAIARIDNRIAELEAAKAGAEGRLELVQSIANGELKLSQELAEKIGMSREALTQYLIDLGVDEAKANKVVNEAMAKNAAELDRVTADTSENMFTNLSNSISAVASNMAVNAGNITKSISAIGQQAVKAAQAIKAMVTGGDGAPDQGVVATGAGGSVVESFKKSTSQGSFKGADVSPIEATRKQLNEEIDKIKLEIDEYEFQLGRMTAAKAKILGAEALTDKALDGARTGKGGKEKKGKKGGGKGKKGSKEKDVDLVKDEADAYHDVNIELKQYSTQLERLRRQEEKLTGSALVDNLNKQLEVLEKQKKTQEKKLEIARRELLSYQKLLALKGVAFNQDGTIANYFEAVEQQLKEVNAVIKWFNALTAEQQNDDKNKRKLDDAKKNYDSFLKLVQNYDKLVSETIPELEDNIQDTIDKEIEINIKKFNMKIEIELELGQAERDWNNFKRKVIDGIKDDDIFGGARQGLADFKSYYKPGGGGSIQNLTDHLNKLQGEISGGGVYGDNRARAMEDLKKYYTELMSQLESVEDLVENIRQSQLQVMDEVSDKLKEQLELYELISSVIQHDMSLIKLVYGEDAFEELGKFFEKQEKNLNKQVDYQRRQVELWRREMELAQRDGNQEAFKKAREQWIAAVNDWRNSIIRAVENIQSKYFNAIDNIFKKLNDKVTGGKGLAYIKEEWQLINKKAEQYLDTVNATFGIHQLEQKYLKSIKEIDRLSDQQKLNDLMQQEIGALREKDKLTKYDIDRANLKYQIALKELALENTRNSKFKIRSRRDSQGNFSYERVADTDEIAKVQDELNKLKNDLYNLDKNQYKNNLDQLLSLWTEFQEKMAEAAKINDPKKRAERQALIEKQYGELITGLTKENEVIKKNIYESAFEALQSMYDKNVKNFENMTKEQKDVMLGQMIPQWESGVQRMAEIFGGSGGFTEICRDAMKELDGVTKDFENSLRELEKSGGFTFESLRQGLDETLDQTERLIGKNDEVIDSYKRELDAIRDVVRELDSLIRQFESAKQAAIEATRAAYELWQMEQRSQSESSTKPRPTPNPSPRPGGGGSSGGGGSQSGPSRPKPDSKPKGGNFEVGDWVIFTGGTYYYDSEGTAPTGSRGAGKKVKITKVAPGAKFPYHVQSSNSAYGWLKKHQLKAFMSGGYTGDWSDPNNNGRLALLHKKELVLNQQDTQNLLDSVKILRGFGDAMLRGLSAQSGVSGQMKFPDNTVEQNVTIHAEFKDATTANEITRALRNLTNVAAQKASSQLR